MSKSFKGTKRTFKLAFNKAVKSKDVGMLKELKRYDEEHYSRVFYGEILNYLDILIENDLLPKLFFHKNINLLNAKIINQFSLKKIDLNLQDENGDTLLHHICKYRVDIDSILVKLMLLKGACPYIENNLNISAYKFVSHELDRWIKTYYLQILKLFDESKKERIGEINKSLEKLVITDLRKIICEY